MSDNSAIEWTDATWNPVTGCTKVSPGCDHCYAETFAERWRGTPGHPFENGFDVTLRPERIAQPLRWRKPRRVFVNSMSDLFHDDVPDDFIARVFGAMSAAPKHTFQILTKRHGRMRSLLSSESFRPQVARWAGMMCENGDQMHDQAMYGPWPLPNVWLGVSVEDQKRADLRIPALLGTPAAVRFLSCEPLLGPVDLARYLTGDCPACGDDITEDPCGLVHADMALDPSAAAISWVIVGGESGPGARPMDPAWARSLRDQCVAGGVPFFFKQWGAWGPTGRIGIGQAYPGEVLIGEPVDEHGHRTEMRRVGKKNAGRELDGRTWDEFPGGAR